MSKASYNNPTKIEMLEALLKLAELLNSTQDTSYILQALLKECLRYIKGGDAGIIFLYNEKEQVLEVGSYVGSTAIILKKSIKLWFCNSAAHRRKKKTVTFTIPYLYTVRKNYTSTYLENCSIVFPIPSLSLKAIILSSSWN